MRKYIVTICAIVPLFCIAQKNSISLNFGQPRLSTIELSERNKTTYRNNTISSLLYTRIINYYSLFIGVEFMNSNIRMDYKSTVPAWAAQSAIYRRRIFSFPIGVVYPVMRHNKLSFNLINGLSVLHSDKLDVQLFNEKTGLDKDSTLRDQDYKTTCAIRNGLCLTYTCNNRLNIVLEGFVDFRLRDFYKENYTWSIWNNKGDGRIATIFKGGIGYRW